MNPGPDTPRVLSPDLTRAPAPPISAAHNEAVGSMTILADDVLAAASHPALLPRSDDDVEEEAALLVVENGDATPPPTGVKSVSGRRKEMEDAVCVAHSFLSLPSASPTSDCHYFAVYDGHGGPQVAMHCREHMHVALAEEVLRDAVVRDATGASIEDRERWETCMTATFLRMDREVGSRSTSSGMEQPGGVVTFSDTVGSTAVTAVLSCRHIIIANCGDSRAVLCRRGQAIALSVDHKPDREDEIARIEAAGGRVFNWNGWRVLGVLAMSRAIGRYARFSCPSPNSRVSWKAEAKGVWMCIEGIYVLMWTGDHFLKPYVIADPDVTITTRSDEDECLILASDGLWDVVSNQDACTIARRFLAANREAQTIATALMQKAYERGSSDNISVVVVDLRRNVEMVP